MKAGKKSSSKLSKSRRRPKWNPGKMSHEDFSDALFRRLFAEKKPILSEGEMESIEKFLHDGGPVRRMATAYLSRPWKEIAKSIEKERDAAVAFAALAAALETQAKTYKELAELLEKAEVRIMLSLCAREDMEEVKKEGAASLCDAGQMIEEYKRAIQVRADSNTTH